MTHHTQFRRHAHNYARYSLIQARVAKALASKIGVSANTVVDLGCGSGGFFRTYEQPFTTYYAIDIAPEMLACHPEEERVVKMIGDFNDASLFETLETLDFDLLVSSSALQWCENLDWTLEKMAGLKRPAALTLFTSATFASLREVTGTPSPIRSAEETIETISKHFDAQIDILKYELYFRDPLSMLRYIKRSGVSGGRQMLGYRETKKILTDYRHAYLEFEVVRAVSKEISL